MPHSAPCITTTTDHCLRSARAAQLKWAALSLSRRLRRVKRLRHQLVRHTSQLLNAIEYPGRTLHSETLAAELIPLADACRFVERAAKQILAPRQASSRLRPLWLSGVTVEQARDPWGVVLVVGAANYPLFLTGVQTVQALVAGNAVLVKPGEGASACTTVLQTAIARAGFDPQLVQRLPESPDYVASSIRAGVDKVVLTGSVPAGRAISQLAAEAMIPVTLELSGCDPVFILEDAVLEQVAQSIAFGLTFNQSATCIAPRRVFVPASCQREFEVCLRRALERPGKTTHTFSPRAVQLLKSAMSAG
ncbi:MAG: aldehyde dehydrogenase family protein, partial [Planctomycetota bacterium]